MSLRVRELTPPGTGAVSVLAISGPGALEAVRSLSAAASIPIGRPSLLRLRADGEELDESIVCAFSPEEVELHLHGSPLLVRRLLAGLGAEPSPRAGAGTIEDLARAHLARATCEAAARILLDQSEGALARGLSALLPLDDPQRGRAIDALLERWRIARWALRPATLVIAGRANAGKSTLFNALLGERRAIVDAEPGTTRDPNRARASLGAWPAILVDTAGERELGPELSEPATQASIERRGQARARDARESADLVLWLEPIAPGGIVGPPDPSAQRDGTILVQTFADRAGSISPEARALSALVDPIGARETVAAAFRARLVLPEDPWTQGAAVPFTPELAREIGGLRGLPRSALAAAIEALVAAGRALP
jgi:tRNA modification GTPase